MPFLGLMTIASHKEILDEAKTEAFGEGVRHQKMTTPIHQNRQPEIDSLRGQLDAAVELKDGYARTIEKLKRSIADLEPDAEKWRARKKADRDRIQAKRDAAKTAQTRPAAKRAAKK